MQNFQHTTVLLSEAIDSLLGGSSEPSDGHFIDATFGRGGHSRLLLSRLSAQAKLTAFDKDPEAIAAAAQINDPRFCIRHESFAGLAQMDSNSAQGILMDLGVSSPQIDDAMRGFSFMRDGPLDMRMDSTRGQTVSEWLQSASESEMAQVIREYGEERFAPLIAKAIAAKIKAGQTPTRTLELANLIANVVKKRDGAQHPATRSFQALRILINHELDDLKIALEESLRILVTGGRLVVIAFHSLEDRIVKQFIVQNSRETVNRDDPKWLFSPANHAHSAMKLVAIDRIKTSEQELQNNPRARSAVMRVAQRTVVPYLTKGVVV